ncbi:MAG: polyribonucleotide nucleotidyltransferase [Planctomycetes bacterium]|nr:polyribonucleotide nucleotidyltransferase [Planctomycetota bacterium]
MSAQATDQVRLGEQTVSFEVGAIARQASGSVLVQADDATLFCVVTAASKPSSLPFMPLTVEYRHKFAAVGKIPGSYQRREARASDEEVLTSRLIDRSIRPFFPDAWRCETQVVAHPLSYEPEADFQVLLINAASLALTVSDVVWDGPVAAVRVVRHEGEVVAFPRAAVRAAADLDLIVTVNRAGIVMVEGGGNEVPEADVLRALVLAQEAALPLLDLQDRLREACGVPKRERPQEERDAELAARVAELATERLDAALDVVEKHPRYEALSALRAEVLAELDPEGERGDAVGEAFEALKKHVIRTRTVSGRRLGGRRPDEVREISGRAGWLKRCHGSSLFTRGETQAVVTCTLGATRDAQRLETLEGDVEDTFLLHYNFPPYSVGECRPMRGPGRREVGHGHLARRALLPLLPPASESPYTIRLESTITESNGSSSMATICGGSLAMLDAGLQLPRPVAGIAMGMVQEGDEVVVLSDILGDEDHVGDMDFKVGGTELGVTAIQLDNKLGAVPREVMERALEQARLGRLHILGEMAKVLAAPREALSAHAPKVATVQIEPQRIGILIGPGGKNIQGLQEETGTRVEVDDSGLVKIFSTDAAAIEVARQRVIDRCGIPRLGEDYEGRVTGVKHFGSFVRLFEGIEGLLPGVQLGQGDTVRVRVTGVNEEGKLQIQRVGG